jgi:hypothetical protein
MSSHRRRGSPKARPVRCAGCGQRAQCVMTGSLGQLCGRCAAEPGRHQAEVGRRQENPDEPVRGG